MHGCSMRRKRERLTSAWVLNETETRAAHLFGIKLSQDLISPCASAWAAVTCFFAERALIFAFCQRELDFIDFLETSTTETLGAFRSGPIL